MAPGSSNLYRTSMPKPKYPTLKGVSTLDADRGRRLRTFREELYDRKALIYRREMAELITKNGYPITNGGYRKWEDGYNIPGEALTVLYNMGLNLNWLFSGKENPKV